MRIPAILFACLLSASAGLSQVSSTLPKGKDSTEGTGSGWATWRYAPARAVYSYNATAFPWGASPKVIRAVSARRDGLITTTFVKNTKKIRLFVSYDGNDPWALDVRFEGNHGKMRTMVLGTAAAPASVLYPADPKPPVGKTAPFTVSFPFSRPFLLPAKTRNLIFDFRAYGTVATRDYWYVDSEFKSGGALTRGSLVRAGAQCPTTPLMTISNYVAWPNATFINYVVTRVAKAPVVAWIGAPLATPIPLGKGCTLYVRPLVLLTGTADNSTLGRATFSWGKIPNQASFIGKKIAYQFAVVKAGYPFLGAVGVTQWGDYTIGSGYANKVDQGTVYKYALSSSSLFDPDRVANADYLSTRAPVLLVR